MLDGLPTVDTVWSPRPWTEIPELALLFRKLEPEPSEETDSVLGEGSDSE